MKKYFPTALLALLAGAVLVLIYVVFFRGGLGTDRELEILKQNYELEQKVKGLREEREVLLFMIEDREKRIEQHIAQDSLLKALLPVIDKRTKDIDYELSKITDRYSGIGSDSLRQLFSERFGN